MLEELSQAWENEPWPTNATESLHPFYEFEYEARAAELLGRALSIGRAVAFVGSGVSMSYGKPSWAAMFRGVVEPITNNVGRDKATKKAIEELKAALKEKGGPERYPLLFELSERIDHNSNRRLSKGNTGGLRGDLREMIVDPVDEARHLFIRSGLWNYTPDPDSKSPEEQFVGHFPKSQNNAARPPDGGECDQKLRDRLQALFSTTFLGKASAIVKKELSSATSDASHARIQNPLLKALSIAGRYRDKMRKHVPLFPSHRFAVAALLRMIKPDRLPEHFATLLKDTGNSPILFLNSAKQTRASRIPPLRDPLLILFERLHISRFLTTNYDSEIETLFGDLGYERPSDISTKTDSSDAARNERFNPLGAPSIDMVFASQRGAQLIEFAIQDPPASPHIIHLHGRADSKDPIVVTERDYQKLYLCDDASRPVVDQAIRLTFAANPILFVGLGMGEDDILRPLRQFMSQQPSYSDRLAVALMPMWPDDVGRFVQQASLLQRYGVYTIYYGSATGKFRNNQIGPCPQWLAIARKVVEIAKEFFKRVPAPDSDDATRIRLRRGNLAEIKSRLKVISSAIKHQPTGLPKLIEIEGSSITDYPDLDCTFEIGVVNACIDIMENTRDSDPNDWKNLERISSICHYVLGEAESSLMSVFLCARLLRIQTESSTWRDAWHEMPEPRNADVGGANGNSAVQLCEPGLAAWFAKDSYILHRQLPSSKSHYENVSRFKDGLRGRAMNEWLASVGHWHQQTYSSGKEAWKSYKGRRLFLFIVPRGVGKGHFFDSLADQTNLSEFLRASWGPEIAGETRKSARYYGAAFLSLSFSNEVASVFDRLTAFLHDCYKRRTRLALSPDDLKKFGDEWDKLSSDRIGRLKYILCRYANGFKLYADCNARVLIAINGIDKLFDRSGKPKNYQLGQLFDTIVANDYKTAPIDLLLISSDESIPGQFRKEKEPSKADPLPKYTHGKLTEIPLILLIAPNSLEHVKISVRDLLLEHRINYGELKSPDDKPGSANKISDNENAVVHVVRPTHALEIAAAYFPRVSLLLTLHGYITSRENKKPKGEEAFGYNDINVISSDKISKFEEAARGHIKVQHDLKLFECHRLFLEDAIKTETHKREFSNYCDNHSKSWDEPHRNLFRTADGSRYAMTILLAAADEHLGPSESDLDFVGKPALGGAGTALRAIEFLDRTQREVRGQARAELQMAVLQRVLGQMERNHAEGMPPPRKLDHFDSIASIPRQSVPRPLGPRLLRLIKTILWHLAIIGQPAEQAVLIGCREVWDDIQDVGADIKGCCIKTNSSRSAETLTLGEAYGILQDALNLLIHRCLVLVISSISSDKPRYVVHRLVQRHVYQQMKAAFIAYPDIDKFCLSLFATQPDDLPQLAPEAHHRISGAIRSLVVSASEAPKDPDTDQELEARSQRLRAVFGVLRSIYHVGIIAHFDGYHEAEGSPPSQGYLELYRQQIGWLIREAKRLDKAIRHKPIARPFYAEEIVWLLNENGVLSLMQGRVGSATAMFERADQAARKLEPSPLAPLRTWIAMNRALADIEQGRPAPAKHVLTTIERQEQAHPALRYIALGYLGLAEHLSGSLEPAIAKYDDAVKGLQQLGRSRAASIFARHKGDAERWRNIADSSAAESALTQAILLAQEGGHADVAHFARLAKIRLNVTKPGELHVAALSETVKQLDAIHTYATVIGLPRLRCEVLAVRARLLFTQGDARHAARIAAESLEIATQYDMRLRKVHALNLLAEIMHMSGQIQECRILLERSATLSNTYGYHHALEWINGRLSLVRAEAR